MTYDQQIFIATAFGEEPLEVTEGRRGGERIRHQNLRLVSHLRSDERSSLDASLEWAGDDEIELKLQLIEDLPEVQAVTLALFVERALVIENRIRSPLSGGRMPKDKEIHIVSRF
jgi:hypothetical protein